MRDQFYRLHLLVSGDTKSQEVKIINITHGTFTINQGYERIKGNANDGNRRRKINPKHLVS